MTGIGGHLPPGDKRGIQRVPAFLESQVSPATAAKLKEARAKLEALKATHAAKTLNDPVAFVNERLGEDLWSKQKEILYSIRDHRLTTVRSCHGSGKSWTVARAVAWWVTCHPPGSVRVITTAPTFKQVRAVLWQEIRKAHSAGKLPGDCMQVEWQHDGALVAQGLKPDDAAPDAFQGIHAPNLLVVLDEANGVAEAIWRAALSLATSENNRIVAIGNPDDPHSMFARTHQPGSGWNQIKISKDDTPNFTGEKVSEAISKVLIGPAWVADAEKMYGRDSPVFVSKVYAEFPEQSEDSLVRMSHARAAVNRTLPSGEPCVLGADIARRGSDSTVLYLRRGPVCRIMGRYRDQDTMATCGHIARALTDTRAANAAIDADGLGAGVFDRLAELGAPVQELRGGFRARDHERFANRRAEWYWDVRTRFEDGDIDIEDTEHTDELLAQLTAIRWKLNSRGQIQIESKDDMAKRGLPSPDLADALVYAFAAWDSDWSDAYGSSVGTGTTDGSPSEMATAEEPPNPWAAAYGPRDARKFSLKHWQDAAERHSQGYL